MSSLTTNFSWLVPTNGDPANVAADEATFLAQIDASLGDAWTAYTPAWTSSATQPVIGDGARTGEYKRFGKWGVCRISVRVGTTTTIGTGFYSFALPAAWTLTTNQVFGAGAFYDSSTTTTYNCTVWNSGTSATTALALRSHNTATDVSATVPVVPASGDFFHLAFLGQLA